MTARETAESIPLTKEDFQRFHRNAPAALARRGWSGMMEEISAGLQTIAFGALPIVGLIWLGWSAAEMLLFLLVGLWVGIFCDTVKLFALRRRAEAFAAARYDDWHVWVVADALRKGKSGAPAGHLRAQWDPFAGVFVDFVMGGISTLVIVIMLTVEAGLKWETLQTPGVMLGVVGYSLVRIASTAGEIAYHRAKDSARGVDPNEWTELETSKYAQEDRPVKAAVGLRGVGLFLLMFLTVFLTDEEQGLDVDVAWVSMIVVNSLVVLYGLMCILAWPLVVGETRWLRDYLDRCKQG